MVHGRPALHHHRPARWNQELLPAALLGLVLDLAWSQPPSPGEEDCAGRVCREGNPQPCAWPGDAHLTLTLHFPTSAPAHTDERSPGSPDKASCNSSLRQAGRKHQETLSRSMPSESDDVTGWRSHLPLPQDCHALTLLPLPEAAFTLPAPLDNHPAPPWGCLVRPLGPLCSLIPLLGHTLAAQAGRCLHCLTSSF